MNGGKANSLFTIKSMIKERPYTITCLIFISSAVVCAYALLVFERPFSY